MPNSTTTQTILQPILHLDATMSSSANPVESDIYKLPPTEALRLLSTSLEALVRITGDVPPTPPLQTPTDPQMSGLQAEKDHIARNRSQYTEDPTAIDGVRLKSHLLDFTPPDSHVQHGAITRKFYSKLEPPISVTQYLKRLHQFCPNSTAVYLATSLYIHRLAVHERAIPITRRNVHRLVLAALRVATKAHEDLAYSHAKVARVGGVSESELARLEVSFCFLAGFEVVIGQEKLQSHLKSLRLGQKILAGRGDGTIT